MFNGHLVKPIQIKEGNLTAAYLSDMRKAKWLASGIFRIFSLRDHGSSHLAVIIDNTHCALDSSENNKWDFKSYYFSTLSVFILMWIVFSLNVIMAG